MAELRIVVDPAVLVSAALVSGSTPDRLLQAWESGEAELLVSLKLLGELSLVLQRGKFRAYLTEEEANEFVAYLRRTATLCPDAESIEAVTADPKDDYLFGLARVARADYIVSGDRHLTELKDPSPLVLTPTQLLAKLPSG